MYGYVKNDFIYFFLVNSPLYTICVLNAKTIYCNSKLKLNLVNRSEHYWTLLDPKTLSVK